jgi:hypothetical protein
LWEGKVNGRDEGEGIWWMDFIYLYKIKQRNLLQLLPVGQGVDLEERQWG